MASVRLTRNPGGRFHFWPAGSVLHYKECSGSWTDQQRAKALGSINEGMLLAMGLPHEIALIPGGVEIWPLEVDASLRLPSSTPRPTGAV